MADKLRVRIVDDVITTDSAGGVVESLPVLDSGEDPIQNTAGQWVDPVDLEEAEDGVPVRFVEDAIVLNSAGVPVAATPSKGGAPALALMFNSSAIMFDGEYIVMGEQDAG